MLPLHPHCEEWMHEGQYQFAALCPYNLEQQGEQEQWHWLHPKPAIKRSPSPRHVIVLADPHNAVLYSHLFKRLFLLTIRRKPVGSVIAFSLLFISSNCWSMISPASLSVSLLAQALQGNSRVKSSLMQDRATALWQMLSQAEGKSSLNKTSTKCSQFCLVCITSSC